MADEASSNINPSADPAEAPMTEAELRDAIFELSSDEATELLNEYAASFYRPAPLQPNNAHEARIVPGAGCCHRSTLAVAHGT